MESHEKESKSFDYLVRNNYDNLLSLVKRKSSVENSLELAICVCMYSEDKTMLRRTLSGISANIANFVK